MVSAEISPKNPFMVTLNNGYENRSFGVRNFQEFNGSSEKVQDLLRTVIVAHLVAPDFPETIETNFPLENTNLINELYLYYDKKPPKIKASREQIKIYAGGENKDEKGFDFVNAHSGGLDSVYRLTKLVSDGESVEALHLRNLNPKSGFIEAEASRNQADAWGICYKELHLVNSSKNFGYTSMRTRDLFVGATAAIIGSLNGAKSAVIEGDFIEDKKDGNFSENIKTWEMFNKILKEDNCKIEVIGIDAGDVETVGELVKLEEKMGISIINLVQNCFSAKFQLPGIRRKWERETPEIAARSSGNWCGSCIKCRRTTLGRLYYHDPAFNRVGKTETDFFINDTYRWLKEYQKHHDLISQGFLKHLEDLGSVR